LLLFDWMVIGQIMPTNSAAELTTTPPPQANA
jgi:hypothetical protein